MRASPIITNFTAGELSPKLEGRVDISKYSNGARVLENFVIAPHGGAEGRPGTYFAAEVKYSSKSTRILPFEFSDVQAYIIEFGHLYMRFFMDDGQLMDGTVPYEIVTPYDEDDLFDVQYAQDDDIMYLVERGYTVRKLTRSGHTSWTLTEVEFTRWPQMDENITTTTITPSADTGSGITITASSALFYAGHVGSVWKIKSGYVEIKTVNSNHLSATADVLYSGNLGTGPGATTEWSEAAWSDYRGWPTAVAFFEQRLVLCRDQNIWMSKSGEYENFEVGAEDDDAIAIAIASQKVNLIRWLSSGKDILAGTTGGIYSVGTGDGSPTTPSNIRARLESSFGGSGTLPLKIGSFVYYIQRNTQTLREISYNLSIDGYAIGDMSILSEHMGREGFLEMAYQESPYNIAWIVLGNGELATMTRQIEQEVIGWSRQVTDGYFESVAVIPKDDYDQVWFLVARTIGGDVKRFIEYLAPPSFGDQEDAFFVDCGLTYDGSPVSHFSGLDHLEGKEVSILADGAVVPSKTVESGAIDLDQPASVVHIGLPFIPTIETMRPEVGSQYFTSQGKLRRNVRIAIRFFESLGCRYGVEGSLDKLPFRDPSMAMDSPPPLFTGDKIVTFPSGFDRDGFIRIEQHLPLPINVTAIIGWMDVAEI